MLNIVIAAKTRFPLGQICMTPGARDTFTPEQIAEAIQRHSGGDWGDICKTDARENETSLKEGFRLMSVYTFGDDKLWVITEADRSATTALLPDEY
ncbi:hypothetical protein P12x_005320 [Tundrisphaera lichenicola]|uniref:hypothetical protein n=1 Tax=Tundrisphaera lichenicola TaxID=2029860 RepID=UPI003EB78CF6